MSDAAPGFCTACGRPLDEQRQCPVHGAGAEVPPPRRPLSARLRRVAPVAVAVVLIGGLVAGITVVRAQQQDDNRRLRRALATVDHRLQAQTDAANGLSRRLATVEARLNSQPDAAAVAKRVEASVFTVVAGDALGTSFVLASSGGSSSLVTNFHVVADEWDAGRHTVHLRQEGRELDAIIDRVSKGDDVAVLVAPASLPVLPRPTAQPSVGDSVLVVGAPLGLGGSVSNGIISAFRDGYIQFSAPIAPGNSGGPLVNLRGEVVGVARSKLVAEGAEGLSFAIPIAVVCTAVSVC